MTYSIVARDPQTGDLGVAVQSHYFGTGTVVTWAQAGVGAVATQSIPEVSYGPKGLDLMRAGVGRRGARRTRRRRSDGDGSSGGVRRCRRAYGNAHRYRLRWPGRSSTGHQVSVQANMMDATRCGGRCSTRTKARREPTSPSGWCWLGGRRSRGRRRTRQAVGGALGRVGADDDAPWDQKKFDLRVDDAEVPARRIATTSGDQPRCSSTHRCFRKWHPVRAGTDT